MKKICNKIEITEMHIEHMENKLVHHEEKGNWVKAFQKRRSECIIRWE